MRSNVGIEVDFAVDEAYVEGSVFGADDAAFEPDRCGGLPDSIEPQRSFRSADRRRSDASNLAHNRNITTSVYTLLSPVTLR